MTLPMGTILTIKRVYAKNAGNGLLQRNLVKHKIKLLLKRNADIRDNL